MHDVCVLRSSSTKFEISVHGTMPHEQCHAVPLPLAPTSALGLSLLLVPPNMPSSTAPSLPLTVSLYCTDNNDRPAELALRSRGLIPW